MGGPERDKRGGSLADVSHTGPSLLPSVFPIHVKKTQINKRQLVYLALTLSTLHTYLHEPLL